LPTSTYCKRLLTISLLSLPFRLLQLSKLACIPFTLLVQYIAYKQSVPRLVQLTLLPITFGVGFATVYDLSLNTVGLGEYPSYFLCFLLRCEVWVNVDI